MAQSKFHSLLETCFSTAVGFIVSLATQLIIVAIWNLPLSMGDNLAIVGIFTVISVARGYLIRRLFNFLHAKEIL